MRDDLVLSDVAEGVARLTLNRPDKFNALSDAMLEALSSALKAASARPEVKVILIAGAGRGFCAGHDLRELQSFRDAPDGGRAAIAATLARCVELMTLIPRLPQPVIAQVHGIATAAGCQLVATCDLAIASESAKFGVNGINIGLFCATPMVALTRNVPRKQAFEALTTGQFLSAERAREIGLINRIAPEGQLEAEADAFAAEIASKLGLALRLGKSAFYDQLALPLEEAYALAGAVMLDNAMAPDTCEGMAAFLDKRAPNWPAGA